MDLLPLGLASGIHDSRHAGIHLVDRVALALLPAGDAIRASATAELRLITADKLKSRRRRRQDENLRWRDLLKLPQTWGTIAAGSFTDPVWFFVTDWFPIYLVAKGIELKSGLIAVWIPFIAADLGNFFREGSIRLPGQAGMVAGGGAKGAGHFRRDRRDHAHPDNLHHESVLIAFLFALATFAYAAFSTMANVLPSDLFHSDSVASVSGMSGTGAGIGTIIAFKLIGYFSDARQATATHAFDPIVIVAGLVPFVGMIVVLLLVRNTKATDEGLVRRI